MRGAVEDRCSGPILLQSRDGPGGWAPARGHPCVRDAEHIPAAGYAGRVHRIYGIPFASVYPLYITKVEKKGRTAAELDEVIEWLTGFDDAQLRAHLEGDTTFQDFFDDADLNPNASQITGVICGMRVEEIEDPLMQKIRYLDKLVDELAKGRAMEKILRGS